MTVLERKSKSRFGLCHGKLRYPNWQIAESQAHLREMRGRALTVPYHCRECNDYHLTTPPKKVKKPVKNGRKSREDFLEE